MSDNTLSIRLSEWETASPESRQELSGYYPGGTAIDKENIQILNASRMLVLSELKAGLEIASTSFVGRICVGNLSIIIEPKLKGTSLLRLLRYAFGFRKLEFISESSHLVDQFGFDDLLVSQLNTEAQELISRGLRKSYVRRNERLSSPRGRININRLALDGGLATASLPCEHFPRLEDTNVNRVLFAGLLLAGNIASDRDLRRESRRLASLMEGQVERIHLDRHLLEKTQRELNRLSGAYTPALSIIQLLLESRGVVLEGKTQATKLPGFLFDMNRFFQAMVSRFLKENLSDYVVRDEYSLTGMMCYHPSHNPLQKQSPTPRPDYAITRNGQLVSLLDAKYRDLWETSLPREMLYQLVVYAVSHRQISESVILYPAMDVTAREARINITDPVYGSRLGQVCLRPVFMSRMVELVADTTSQGRQKCEKEAIRMAFGT